MYLYSFLLHSHSMMRYVALLLLVMAVVISLLGVIRKTSFNGPDLKIPLWAMVAFHVQVLFGFVLYVISPKVQFSGEMMKSDQLRFYTVEHILLMLISVIFITIGYVQAKKKMEQGHKKILVFYAIALLLVLIAIPWPFREALGTKWL